MRLKIHDLFYTNKIVPVFFIITDKLNIGKNKFFKCNKFFLFLIKFLIIFQVINYFMYDVKNEHNEFKSFDIQKTYL